MVISLNEYLKNYEYKMPRLFFELRPSYYDNFKLLLKSHKAIVSKFPIGPPGEEEMKYVQTV